MRFAVRLVVFVVLILAAFWFTARNANELVNVVVPFVRIRVSLPLLVFACILGGMGLSALVAWRADRRARRREHRAASARLAQEPPPVARRPRATTSPAAPPPATAPTPAESRAPIEPPEAADPPEPAEPSPLL